MKASPIRRTSSSNQGSLAGDFHNGMIDGNVHRNILVTGGTGYVGGRLIPLLQQLGESLRLMARPSPTISVHELATISKIVEGDVHSAGFLSQDSLRDIDTAYYLIHSMGSGSDFEEQDRLAARNFATAARENDVRRIIYLGGLGDASEELSKHLRSRQEVGEVLRESGAEVIEFRASIIIGSGSLSFELIRSLVQKLPIMICPRWVGTKAQPIAIEDILTYLVKALDLNVGGSQIYEIGGPDQVSYGEIMQEYARQRQLQACHGSSAIPVTGSFELMARSCDPGVCPSWPEVDRQSAKSDISQRSQGAS